MDLIQKHKSIEEIVRRLTPTSTLCQENWLHKEAQQLFLEPELDPESVELKWSEPNEEELRFMCGEKQFSEERIRSGVRRLSKSRLWAAPRAA